MSPIRQQLVNMIDYIPEQEQLLLFEIAKRFIPDNIATEDDIAAIREAKQEYANGETVSHSDINWD